MILNNFFCALICLQILWPIIYHMAYLGLHSTLLITLKFVRKHGNYLKYLILLLICSLNIIAYKYTIFLFN